MIAKVVFASPSKANTVTIIFFFVVILSLVMSAQLSVLDNDMNWSTSKTLYNRTLFRNFINRLNILYYMDIKAQNYLKKIKIDDIFIINNKIIGHEENI